MAAALNEQKKLNLPWYAKLKPLLEIDEIECDLYSTIRKNLIDNLNKYRDECSPLISHSSLKDYPMQLQTLSLIAFAPTTYYFQPQTSKHFQ